MFRQQLVHLFDFRNQNAANTQTKSAQQNIRFSMWQTNSWIDGHQLQSLCTTPEHVCRVTFLTFLLWLQPNMLIMHLGTMITSHCTATPRVTWPMTVRSSLMPMSDNCVLPTSNAHCQSDAQQFWRQDLCRHRTTSLEQSAAQSHTTCTVIWPVQAVTEDVFIRTVRPRHSVNCFNCAEQKYSYLVTYSQHL